MQTPAPPFFDRLIELWNQPPESRDPAYREFAYYRDRSQSVKSILDALRASYTESRIRVQIGEFFKKMTRQYEQGANPSERDSFLANCCLEIVDEQDQSFLTKEIAADIVRTFPSIIWYSPVGDVVETYLSDAELIETLMGGLTENAATEVCTTCLEGLRLYAGLASRDPDRGRLKSAVADVRRRLSDLRSHPDELIRNMAPEAEKHLAHYER